MAGIIRLNIYLSFDFFNYKPLKLDPTVRKQGLAYSSKTHSPPLRVSLPLRSDFSGHKKRRAKQPYCFDLKKKKKEEEEEEIMALSYRLLSRSKQVFLFFSLFQIIYLLSNHPLFS